MRTGRLRIALVTLVGAGVLLTGCSGDGDQGQKASSDGAKPQAAPGAAGAAGPPNAQTAPKPGAAGTAGPVDPAAGQRKVVLTAEIRIKAKDVQDAVAQAQSLIRGAGGRVADEQTRRDAGRQDSTLVLKVPPAVFDASIDDLSKLGEVQNRQRNAKDVTDEVVDVGSRTDTQRASVARVRELLAKATTISDIVSLEAELTKREAELESLLKRQQSLTAQADQATITLAVSGDLPTEPVKEKEKKKDDGFADQLGDGLGGGWHVLVVVVTGILVVVVTLLPFLAIALVLWLLNRFTGRPAQRWIAAWRAKRERTRASRSHPWQPHTPLSPPRPPGQPEQRPSAE